MPWLNRIDGAWLRKTIGARRYLFTIDDHYLSGGQGQLMAAALLEHVGPQLALKRFGLTELPVCGSHLEVLRHHGLDAESLARSIATTLGLLAPRTRSGPVRHVV
jgi:transketolase